MGFQIREDGPSRSVACRLIWESLIESIRPLVLVHQGLYSSQTSVKASCTSGSVPANLT